MAQTSRLAKLGQRRALLLSQSSELRYELAEDFKSLESSCVWVDRGYALIRAARALWPWSGRVAGFALSSSKAGWLSKAQTIWSGFQLGKRVVSRALQIIKVVPTSPNSRPNS